MEKINIQTSINVRVETIWNAYTSAEDIMQWNHAAEDWHCTSSTNDLRIGGKFKNHMEAKDGSAGFDFVGTYTALDPFKRIAYDMADGRHVEIHFDSKKSSTDVSIIFDAESENPIEMQREGWRAILNNFKSYVEKTYGILP
ncbi:SRPBCC domain-containing protein [Sphingobacterium thalpophilum]|uniref:Activator of Hsp90 ATPase homolog 1-like protein n=1 Tax=Sphingobacterium thalpophilum TaxID=259 RepID=A0A4U9VFX3_9SPHI|nr:MULTISPECIES: SRPBCC domain-containing protein [Sphingobacterium]MCW8312877.1 SRPBCC domain-containing protein [Sphingobacterium sp. InxBP1]VTR41981.1 Activator of Hsp90 ATPase homolog 1-like protein [Sphingobacterium thalpophilum]